MEGTACSSMATIGGNMDCDWTEDFKQDFTNALILMQSMFAVDGKFAKYRTKRITPQVRDMARLFRNTILNVANGKILAEKNHSIFFDAKIEEKSFVTVIRMNLENNDRVNTKIYYPQCEEKEELDPLVDVAHDSVI